MVMQRFDPKKADSIIQKSQQAPDWLPRMIDEPKWRQLIYTLSKEHKDCELLNFTIQLISEAGHQTEIASLTSASIYFSVFNRVLSGTLERVIRTRDETELDKILPDFKQMCNHSQHTYSYAQAMLRQLSAEPNGANLVRLSEELYDSVKEYPMAEKLDTLLSDYSSSAEDLKVSIVSIIQRKSVGHGDVLKLHGLYTSPQPPPVHYIRRPDILQYLIRALFLPGGEAIPMEYRDCYYYVLAYTSCKREGNTLTDPEKDEINNVINALRECSNICHRLYVGRELQSMVSLLSEYLVFPVVSMGVLFWSSVPLSDPGWYVTNYNTQSIQILLDLLKEMSSINVFQRREILKLFTKMFTLETELDSLASLDVKRKILDGMIYLMECGCVLPVLDTVENWCTEGIDQSLIRYFVTKVLDMVGPPYSKTFIDHFLKVVSVLGERSIHQNPEYKQSLLPFIATCISTNGEESISLSFLSSLQEDLRKIMKKETYSH
eukprot:TRINITY_DN2556_c0_g1_i2.p1 TRINITY_DN2556_c0_g1~~TRINITY_DN2556_c0_g1_i2.p1  ORF type:complete len:491 (-),score=73.21 TRINITY_DN2556_c0_g1_i2:36-1508(-)